MCSGSIFYKREGIARIVKYLTIFGFIIHTIGIIYKTIEAEHAPFTNMYESIIFFSWVIVIFYLFIDYKYEIKIISMFVIPIVVLGLGYARTISREPEPLIPALQSIWLEIHVATSFIGYAGFAVAYGVGLMYLLKKPKETDRIPSNFNFFNVSFILSSLLTFAAGIVINFIEKLAGIIIFPKFNFNNERISKEFLGFALSNIILISVFLTSFILIFLICYIWREKFSKELISLFSELNIAIVITGLIYYIIKSIIFNNSFSDIKILGFNTLFCLIIFFVILASLMIRHEKIEASLPDLNILDSIIFISIALGFPFLTAGIITGAIWANSAWGAYWGWDPKETWSLITWFVYAAYLHARYTKGWRDAKASYLAVYGFIAVIFTYFGVNLLFTGLHSYA